MVSRVVLRCMTVLSYDIIRPSIFIRMFSESLYGALSYLHLDCIEIIRSCYGLFRGSQCVSIPSSVGCTSFSWLKSGPFNSRGWCASLFFALGLLTFSSSCTIDSSCWNLLFLLSVGDGCLYFSSVMFFLSVLYQALSATSHSSALCLLFKFALY